MILKNSLYNTDSGIVQALSNQNFFHVLGKKRTSSGKSSSLPASISKDKTSFEKTENSLKFIAGPTALRPGPILLTVAATAVKFVVKSKLSTLISRTENVNSRI